MRRELESLGVDAPAFADLMHEIQETALWRVPASSATQAMAAETERCYGSKEAARLKIAWNATLRHDQHEDEFRQRRDGDWWRCLDPADTEWPEPPGPPPALFGGGWADGDTVQARRERHKATSA